MRSKELAGLISKIRIDIPLTSVVESLGMPLVKAGANLKTFCPFNTHSRATVELYDATNDAMATPHYHCFACGAHGDVFDLVKEVRSTDFNGAVEWLAGRYGLTYSKKQSRNEGKKTDAAPTAENPYALALQIYRKNSDRKKALEWLRSREIPEIFYDKAELSFAAKRVLSETISTEIIKPELRLLKDQLESANLIRRDAQPDTNFTQHLDLSTNYRDFFYDERIIFPIRNHNGLLLGFAGRLYGIALSEKTPKYLYTPKLPKSEILYRSEVAFSILKKDSSNESNYSDLYICEGIIDAIRLESLGFASVAILGAQLSEKQLSVINDFSNQVQNGKSLRCFVFLDRDSAGKRGAAKSIKLLLESGIQSVFVWTPTPDKKDPDEILKTLSVDESVALLSRSLYQPALIILSDELGVDPDKILDDVSWGDISISKRYQAARKLAKTRTEELYVFYVPPNVSMGENRRWQQDVEDFRNEKKRDEEYVRKALSQAYIQDSTARLNHARSLAKAGAQRGEVPSDEAAWRRIDIAATTFNEVFKSRLSQRIFSPMEPFDAVLVSRGFGKEEPRLKAMPCPEDLIVQQYILNEILTERLDSLTHSLPFSRHIPAVRYYRGNKKTITTAETAIGGEHQQTLSFAYQIDMDVVEGSRTATDQGMFRPYIECWRDFNISLQRQSRKMPVVHMVRLDLTRYYDNLSRSTVRNSLKLPLSRAFDSIKETGKTCAELFFSQAKRSDALTDWLCDQSFGYSYYSPSDGSIATKPGSEYIGIPQGPVLSAWLATISLFPLDSAIRVLLEKINTKGEVHIGYARYVDDVVLLADTPELLSVLRATAEESIARLQLIISQKGDRIPPLSPDKFIELLSEGRAIIGSGPTWEPELMQHTTISNRNTEIDPPSSRITSLNLLNDSLLYTTDKKNFKSRVYTALQAKDLRPGDLSKVTSKIWYLIAQEMLLDDDSAKIGSRYWKEWTDLTIDVDWTLDGELNPWDDPAFYALEGLELLIRATHNKPPGLDDDQEQSRKNAIFRLSTAALRPDFCKIFENSGFEATRPGKGIKKLNRMFWQRFLMLRWKILDILPADNKDKNISLASDDKKRILAFYGSLTRTAITEIESSGKDILSLAQSGDDSNAPNPLRSAAVWLHHAIALFKIEGNGKNDPLTEIIRSAEQEIIPKLRELEQGGVLADVVQYLLPEDISASELNQINDWPDSHSHSKLLALNTLTAISIRGKLLDNLKRRQRLLNSDGIGRLQPSPPGVDSHSLILLEPSKEASPNNEIWHVDFLSLISLSPASNTPDSAIFLRESKASSSAQIVPTDWIEQPNSSQHLLILKSKWRSSAKKIHVKPPSLRSITPATLWFVADTFNALARINFSLANASEGKLEYLAAWPYIACDNFYDESEAVGKYYSMLCPPVYREHLGNLAFIRDGFRGLRTVQVPGGENAWLWRIGFAITDIIGLIDDLDHHKVEINDRQNELDAAEFDPGRYVLRAILQRLRGKYAHRITQSQQGHHLPPALERCLVLLNRYPAAGTQEQNMWYAFAVDWENRAMACRIDSQTPLDSRGEVAHFLNINVNKVFTSLPVAWAEALPKVAESVGNSLIYRRGVSAWLTIGERLNLLTVLAASDGPSSGLGDAGLTINAGLRISAVTYWIKALALELYGLNKNRIVEQIDMANFWGIEGATLVSGNDENDVFETFNKAIGAKRILYNEIEKITPIGWLTILAYEIGVFDQPVSGGADFNIDLAEKISVLANDLAPPMVTNPDVELWPFECCVEQAEELWNSDFLSRSLNTLTALDNFLGLSVTNVDHTFWGYDPVEDRFRDSNGSTWNLNGWRINQLSWEKHIEEYLDVNIYRKIWTETRNDKNELVGVSVLGQRFSRFSAKGNIDEKLNNKESPAAVLEVPLSAVTERNQSDLSSSLLKLTDDFQGSERIKEALSSSVRSNIGTGTSSVTPTDYIGHPFAETQGWQAYQAGGWTPRQAKASGHIRMALLQFRVDDSYYHPLNEIGWPSVLEDAFYRKGKIARKRRRAALRAKLGGENTPAETLVDAVAIADGGAGEEWKWTATQNLPSWAEHRRRRILLECLKSCESFKVDALVVPEYSLRPDTIAWLKRWMEAKGSKVSVVAGTYRLHGRPHDGSFRERFAEIFGEGDHAKIFGEDSSLSMEKTAYITLLSPQKISAIGNFVGVFSRAKKYPAVAMGEFFRPGIDVWSPLFTLEKLVDYIEYFYPNKDGSPVVGAKEILKVSNDFIPLRSIAELICSELFLPTSPTNWPSIASEYKKLLVHFGMQKSSSEAYKIVRQDLDALAMSMSPSGFSDDGDEHHCVFPRRSILIVPALTSRSADYWIYGQSALLSAGVTTVFCTGSGKDLSGGSCIIGRKSWDHKGTGKVGVQDHITPYAGWSRGIYYNGPEDALGKEEQALVIADIDPSHMLEGRPRPQVLPVPLQLVAHLPIIESVDPHILGTRSSEWTGEAWAPIASNLELPLNMVHWEKIANLANAMQNEKLSPFGPAEELGKLITKAGQGKAFTNRLEHWKKNCRDMPSSSPSPAFIDWIWVDLTPNEGRVADVFVPPWSNE